MRNIEVAHSINGILLVNKSTGLTSNAVLQQAKRLFSANKAGHTGSLDPLATGMLPVCFGEATKFCQYLLDADKCYEVTGLFGVKTNTGDSMGEVIASHDNFTISSDELNSVLAQFSGPIQQVPPMFSALKHQGQPLYKFARAGIDIERTAREVFIRKLQLNQFDGQFLSLTVTCSKGTYIRNLIEDIAERLGTFAHVTRLHRLYTAGFDSEPMFTLEELKSQAIEELMPHLLPPERAIHYLPKLILTSESVHALRQGKTLANVNTTEFGCVRLYDQNRQFVGLGDLQDSGLLKVRRLMHYT